MYQSKGRQIDEIETITQNFLKKYKGAEPGLDLRVYASAAERDDAGEDITC